MSRKVKGFLVVVGLAVVVAVIAAVAGGNSSSGFHNLQTLESSIQQQADSKLANAGSTDTVTNVACNPLGGNQYQCILTGSQGANDTYPVTVTVAPNGQSWSS